ncbi:hypothetical protein Zmor_013395 [Zophobas morio]|uniref:Uncharacterized protein n=1 Tax=Zophobas morio TaxID=2755281 RepID=A0AA38MFJ4_9CUCU|nr:hypothetical protein Zmor_013395 [Zophobas morio]
MLVNGTRTCTKTLLQTVARSVVACHTRNVTYVQGQEPEPKVREYFYYIDHQGMLFLDDSKMKNFTSCFKEKKFLQFFFNQLKLNNTDRYKEFPYLSICGKERNFVRCDDFPVVFTNVISKNLKDGSVETHLAYNHAGDLLSHKFEPNKIIMIPDTGRVYHPAPERTGFIGLVRSKLAIEFSKYFTFNNGESNPPTHFTFNDVTYELDNAWYLKHK